MSESILGGGYGQAIAVWLALCFLLLLVWRAIKRS